MKISSSEISKETIALLCTMLAISFFPGLHLTSSATLSSIAQERGFPYLVVIVMENRNYGDVIGNTASAPYINRLARNYSVATDYFDVSSNFSLPNYMGLVAGNTYSSWSRCNAPPYTCPGWTAVSNPTLIDRLDQADLSWKAYMEDMPADCYPYDSGLYVARHDPFVYLASVLNSTSGCGKVVPAGKQASALISDLSSVTTASNFMWLTPNLCEDMHNCSTSTGDAYLSTVVPAILGSNVFKTQNATLFITWDEGWGTNSTHIPAIWAGPMIRNNYTSPEKHDHYSLLKTLESVWGFPSLTANDAAASAMTEFLQPPTISLLYAPNHPWTGQTISFSASLHGGASPFSLSWSFGDGGHSTLKQTSHAYSDPGPYTVSLSVVDALNNTASSTTTLEISPIIPNPSPRAVPLPAPGSWLLGTEPLGLIAMSAAVTILCGLLLARVLEDAARKEARKTD